MTFETEIPVLIDWILPALIAFVSAVAAISLLGWLLGFIVSSARHGPVEGFYSVAKVIASAVSDLSQLSLRRTMAMVMLAIQESIRRRVLIAFAVFVVLMLFAGWYLDVQSDNPARLYLSFVLTASNYLVILLALFLSTFSLPTDIKNRTIYTIVTKPVRPIEIVVGRIFGFAAVGTLLLMAMCAMSYVFVVRGLNHRHEYTIPSSATGDASLVVAEGDTSVDAHHRHTVTVFGDGRAEASTGNGHRHVILSNGESSAPIDMLQARVPHWGQLRFLDRSGKPGAGINVGHEWGYRSYIEGGSLAAAIWTFENVSAARYPDGMNMELGIRVFRTHKGDIEKGILGSIIVKNPNPAAKIRSSEPMPFTATEFAIDRQFIPRKLKARDSNGAVRDVDLYEDLADNGRIEIWIQCGESGQYYGMAGPDLYILDQDGKFWLNFIKGYVSIWLQMLLVCSFGVMFSTFLNGAVAMLATLSTIIVGMFRTFIIGLFTGEQLGGGPVEATIRVITQANLSADLEIGSATVTVVKVLDFVVLWFLWALSTALPDYMSFGTSDYVAYGYNISADLMTVHLLKTAAYVLIVSMIGYFFMKTREVAA